MHDVPKTPGRSLAPAAAGNAGLEGSQMVEHRSENPFC